jgi:lambda family phage minor tail protein L
MAIRADVAGLEPLDIVELYEWNISAIKPGEPPFYWHPGTTVAGGPVTWKGQQYEPFPIEVEGFEKSASGALPRPTLRVSNIGGLIGNYIRGLKDGLGAKVIRRRTLGKYLDAVNFPGGNPYADPAAAFPDEVYYVSRKTAENPLYVEVELAVKFDVQGIALPRRQVLSELCPWIYRGPYCGYAGPPVQDINGNPTSNMVLDQCRKTLAACQARFGTNAPLPHGGFPGSQLMRLS